VKLLKEGNFIGVQLADQTGRRSREKKIE